MSADRVRDDILSAVTKWHLYKEQIATNVMSGNQQVSEFTTALDNATREIIATLGIRNQNVWESLSEIVANGTMRFETLS